MYSDTARAWLGLQERDGPGANRAEETMTMCQATRFAGVQYLPPYWKECDYPCKPENNFMWLDTERDFNVAPGAGFACDSINGLIMRSPWLRLNSLSRMLSWERRLMLRARRRFRMRTREGSLECRGTRARNLSRDGCDMLSLVRPSLASALGAG